QKNYDLVILDSPPVLGIADSLLVANVSAGTLFVIEASGMRIGNVRNAIKRMQIAKARLLGAVLTNFRAQEAGYYTSDYYYSDGYSVYGGKPEQALTKA